MDKVFIYVTIAVYLIFMLAIGIINNKNTKSISTFTIGKRNAGAWISALSYGTAYFSAVMFIGYSGNSGWNFGLWAVLVGIGNAIFGSLLAWLILANRTRDVSRRLEVKSMPQFFEKRYLSKRMKLFSAVVIFIFLIPYSASVYKGLSSVCSVVLDIDVNLCMILIALASMVVLILGGYMATLKADFVQGFIIAVGVVFLIVFVLRADAVQSAGGISGLVDYMQNSGLFAMNSSKWIMLLSTVLMTSFGTWGLPQMIHKYYGIKDKQEVKRATIISTLFALLVAGGGYFIGSFSHLFFGETLPSGGIDYVVPNMLKIANIPAVLLGIILVLLISASVSTLSSIALTASSVCSMDIIKDRKPHISDKELPVITKVICALFVICSYVVANTDTPILDMMSYSWGIISGSFLAPYFLALYFKRLNKIGAWSGMITGFVTAVIPALSKIILIIAGGSMGGSFGEFITKLAGYGPVFAVVAMLLSIAVCIVVSLLTQKKDDANNYSYFYTEDIEKEKAKELSTESENI